MNTKSTAVYVRVSTNQQSTRSQEPDLKRWINAQDPESLGPVVWFSDTASGKTLLRPGWQKLQAAIDRGEIGGIVCWRLDRLGRTAAGLCRLFEDLQARKINLVSLKEHIDLNSPSGRLLANILASVAAFETELRGERVKAGQAAAKAKGTQWGGSTKGRLLKVTPPQLKAIVKLKAEGERPTNIAQITGLDRSSIYRILRRIAEGHLDPETALSTTS